MSLFDHRAKIESLLYEAVTDSVDFLKKEFKNNDVYALVFTADLGYAGIGLSYETVSAFEKQPKGGALKIPDDLLEECKDNPEIMEAFQTNLGSDYYYEVNAIEWSGFGALLRFCAKANKFIVGKVNKYYDSDEKGNPQQFFESILTGLILKVRNSGMLNCDAFTGDVLLGVQFPGPDENAIETAKRVSAAVNSPEWHSKVCEAYGLG